MTDAPHRFYRGLRRLLLAWCVGATVALAGADDARWVTAWTTAPLAETPGKDTPPLLGGTVRQVMRVTIAGTDLRLRFGNHFGAEPLVLEQVGVRSQAGDGAMRTVRFGGQGRAEVAPGSSLVSDPVDLSVVAGETLDVSFVVAQLPRVLTGHSAARATSSVIPAGAEPGAAPVTFTRWYFLAGIDVVNPRARAFAILGDSITDGYGIAPDSYARFPDALARRLQAEPAWADIAVLNLGIGGNRLLRDGLGPRALDRVQRDVFDQPGVGAVMLFLGINDIGTRLEARKQQQAYASAADIIGALQHLAEAARARALKVVGATITPYRGADFYWSEDGEADRQAVNDWIRRAPCFDAVVDFDAALRDPAAPDRLAAAFDSGDHLHPSPAGYAELARAIDPALVARLTEKGR